MTSLPAVRRRVCIVSTVPSALTAFMAPHVRALSAIADVTLVTTGGRAALGALAASGVRCLDIEIRRDVAPWADLQSLVALWRLFRREKFDVVHSITPKAGLLSMVAALLAGVPHRLHWFVGQVWATRTGVARFLLRSLDIVLARAATGLLADSRSQRAFLEQEGVVRPGEVAVLGDGSVCGVDTSRFKPDAEVRASTRRELHLPDDALVVLYLGRLNPDKGIPELTRAFGAAAAEHPKLYLLAVGPDETSLRPWMVQTLGAAQTRLKFVDYTSSPERYMAAADIFMLPSHREGFGATVIEAAACEVPTIGTSIYGLTDAIVDGETGLLVPVGDVRRLTAALNTLVGDRALLGRLGATARRRVVDKFSEPRLTEALLALYRDLRP